MSTPDDIAQQQELLQAHRQTLQLLLRQEAQYGAADVPPHVVAGIAEARAAVQRLKGWLRQQGAAVTDLPGDEPAPPAETPTQPLGAAGPGEPLARGEVVISGGAVSGPVVGYNSGVVQNVIGGSAAAGGLAAVLARLSARRDAARAAGNADQADDLDDAARSLDQAIRADAEGKRDRSAAKLAAARESLRALAASDPSLGDLVAALEREGRGG